MGSEAGNVVSDDRVVWQIEIESVMRRLRDPQLLWWRMGRDGLGEPPIATEVVPDLGAVPRTVSSGRLSVCVCVSWPARRAPRRHTPRCRVSWHDVKRVSPTAVGLPAHVVDSRQPGSVNRGHAASRIFRRLDPATSAGSIRTHSVERAHRDTLPQP
ncbi:hypothetical protein LX36DRAFT_256801 [Colletotrichum falcatum]|nr:hypothetical protein LX36DRAFT_256801 [Colletotrichum falcatum]